jgi:glutathione peroxidase
MIAATATSIYDIPVTTLAGTLTSLQPYRGKVMLIVNVASKCVFTAQYAGLEDLYRTFQERGLVVLGFPCNQFMWQEPGDPEAIQSFCSVKYNVTFPMFAKVDVNGASAHPLYKHLKAAARGFLWSRAIKWNFTKFLVDRTGTVIRRFASTVPPQALTIEIEKLLAQPA